VKPQRFERYDPDVATAMSDASLQGGLPDYLGVRTDHVGPGEMTCSLAVRDELRNPFGTIHGGVLSALVDHVLGAVLYPVIPHGAWAATTEFKVNLIRPVREGTLSATARIASLGRRTAVVQVEVHNDARLAGLAQGTVTVVPPRTSSKD
jgi:1,4-dihydroxy-2-naphthoyl-CoA hydrolase